MTKFQSMLATVLVLLAASVGDARAVPVGDQVDRLTDALVTLLPFGVVFDRLKEADPKWPMQERPDAINADQLACVRGELSSSGYRRMKRAEVEKYVKANPSRIEAELKVLESGAAELFGKLILAGADAEASGKEADTDAVLAGASNDQVLSFMTFFQDPNLAALRKLSGIGDALNTQASAEENESRGEQLGGSLAVQTMIKAMGTCKIPPSAYL